MSIYYQDDMVTLYHGDCLTEHREWLDADVLVTDPPYGINYRSGGMSNATVPIVAAIKRDDSTVARDLVIDSWGRGPAIVFGSWRQPRPQDVKNRLIWHKKNALPGMRSTPWFAADEEIYILGSGWTGPPRQGVYATDGRQDGAHGLVAQTGHPTPKPVGLMSELVAKCPPGVIADPFAGSGSTLIAAKILGRRAIGVELDEAYCEIAAKRLAQGVLDLGANA